MEDDNTGEVAEPVVDEDVDWEEIQQKFQRAVSDGAIGCSGCRRIVDLSDSDTVPEAINTYMTHLETEHND